MLLTVVHPHFPVVLNIMSFQLILPFFWHFSADSAVSSYLLQKFKVLVRTVRVLPANVLPEVRTWRLSLRLNRFKTHLEVFHIFLIGDVSSLEGTISSRFALLAITCRIPGRNEWKFRWQLIKKQRFDAGIFKDVRHQVRLIYVLNWWVIVSGTPCSL